MFEASCEFSALNVLNRVNELICWQSPAAAALRATASTSWSSAPSQLACQLHNLGYVTMTTCIMDYLRLDLLIIIPCCCCWGFFSKVCDMVV